MPYEVKGSRLRIRVATPIKGCIYRTQLLGGRPHHAQRIAMKCPGEKWLTQSYSIPLSDIRSLRPTTMKMLEKLGYKQKALKLVGII